MRQNGQTVLVIGRNYFSPRETTIERFQVADTVTWVRGRHTFKAGRDLNRDKILNFFPGTSSASTTLRLAGQLQPRRAQRRPASATSRRSPARARPAPRPSRTSRSSPPSCRTSGSLRKRRDPVPGPALRPAVVRQAPGAQPRPAARRGRHRHQLPGHRQEQPRAAPRRWSGTPNEQTVLRAGYGLFYGRTPSIMVGTAHSNNGVNVQLDHASPATRCRRTLVYPARLDAPHRRRGVPGRASSSSTPTTRTPRCTRRAPASSARCATTWPSASSYLDVAGRNLQRSRDFNVGGAGADRDPDPGRRLADRRPLPTARPVHELRPHHPLREHGRVDLQRRSPSRSRKRFRGGLQASLSYTLGKVEDTKPDATAVVPGSTADDAKYASNPAGPRGRPRAGRQRRPPPRRALAACGTSATGATSSGCQEALLDGWSLSLDRDAQAGPAVLASASTNDLNNDGNCSQRHRARQPQQPSACPPPTSVDLRAGAADPARARGRIWRSSARPSTC